MSSVGPFPPWLAAAGLAAGMVWLVYQVDRTAGYALAGVLLVSVAVLRPGVVQSFGAILNDLSGSGGGSTGSALPPNQTPNTGGPFPLYPNVG